jgi:hypothetical protein
MNGQQIDKKGPKKAFFKKLALNFVIGALIMMISLGIGMGGYHYTENMSWLDAFVNAAMILSGMGPVDPLHQDSGKLFAGCYALYSGIIFLIAMAIVFAPIYHRFIRKIHLEDSMR